MITGSLLPMVVLPLTFLFVLLIILIAKAPRVGAWVVGGLVFLAPILLLRFAHAGGIHGPLALPLFVLPVTFLFVLLVILLAKAPKTGAGLIVAIIIMAVAGLFFVPIMSHRRAGYVSPVPQLNQWTESAGEKAARIRESERVFQIQTGRSAVAEVPGPGPVPPAPPAPPAPIWSEGVEQEFEASIYPSSLAAARALGRRIAKPIRSVVDDPNTPLRVILFQENNDRSLIATFRREVEKELPGVPYSVAADLRNINAGEVGLTLRIDAGRQIVARAGRTAATVQVAPDHAQMVATAFTEGKRAGVEASFLDKPWVESFAAFASERPDQHFIIARSNGACTSESEANQQALNDAGARLTEALGKYAGRRLDELGRQAISTTDVLNGGFVVDRFVQSFDTTTGKVWRQALLIDVSGSKLSQLAAVKLHQSRQVRESWARMALSVVGVLVLISVIYFFLNMATRGYYEWSLRIAGVVLAIVAIVSILMIVQ